MLFVSHNLAAVRKLCPRSMLLSHGQKIAEGPTDSVLETYVDTVRADAAIGLRERSDREGSGRYQFTSIRFESGGELVDTPVSGRELDIVLSYEAPEGGRVRSAVFGIAIYTILGTHILQCQSDVSGASLNDLPPEGEVRCRLPRLPLPAGRYAVNVLGTAAGDIADWVQRACELTVTEGDFYGSGRTLAEGNQTVLVDQDWDVREAASAPAALTPASGGAS